MDAFFLKIIFTPKLYDCKYYQTIWFTGKKIIIGLTQVRSLVDFFFTDSWKSTFHDQISGELRIEDRNEKTRMNDSKHMNIICKCMADWNNFDLSKSSRTYCITGYPARQNTVVSIIIHTIIAFHYHIFI